MKKVLIGLAAVIAIVVLAGLSERLIKSGQPKDTTPEVKLIRACGQELNARITLYTDAKKADWAAFKELETLVNGGKPTEKAFVAYLDVSEETNRKFSAGLENYGRCLSYMQLVLPGISANEAKLALNYLKAAYDLLMTFDVVLRFQHDVVDKACMQLYHKHAPPIPKLPRPEAPPPLPATKI